MRTRSTSSASRSRSTATRSSPTRTQPAKLLAGDGSAGDILGTAVDVAGSTVIAGAIFDDIGPNRDQGSAVVFYAPARNAYGPAVLADAPAGYWRLGESAGTTAR